MEDEQEINEIRLRRKRESAAHETTLATAAEAMALAKRSMDKIMDTLTADGFRIVSIFQLPFAMTRIYISLKNVNTLSHRRVHDDKNAFLNNK